ncbi:MAG: hypothetical protein LBT99_00125 [Bifidobacteriaceae bacterium]|jgi:hypothetical protein|nr:hypothetical protein [Bifidobacteriaceae bacterium]
MRIRKYLIVIFVGLGCLSLLCGSVILTRYCQMSQAIDKYNNKAYEDSIQSFGVAQPILAFEPWKEYFNKGTAFLQMANYNEARDNFQISYNLASGDNRARCLIANNWAVSFEQNAASYTNIFKQTKSQAISKAIIAFLNVAATLRNQQLSFCQNYDQDFLNNLRTVLYNDTNVLNNLVPNNSQTDKNTKPPKSNQTDNNKNELNNQNTDAISEYLNAYDLVNGSTDFQGQKW